MRRSRVQRNKAPAERQYQRSVLCGGAGRSGRGGLRPDEFTEPAHDAVKSPRFQFLRGALDRLEGFASHHGADFYGLPRNQGSVTLRRETWTLPETVPFGDTTLKPLGGGETLTWRLA